MFVVCSGSRYTWQRHVSIGRVVTTLWTALEPSQTNNTTDCHHHHHLLAHK